MTLGNKIAALRSAAQISQEDLAEKLGVSRQSVSKWEMDQSLPQLDKILLLRYYIRVLLWFICAYSSAG